MRWLCRCREELEINKVEKERICIWLERSTEAVQLVLGAEALAAAPPAAEAEAAAPPAAEAEAEAEAEAAARAAGAVQATASAVVAASTWPCTLQQGRAYLQWKRLQWLKHMQVEWTRKLQEL